MGKRDMVGAVILAGGLGTRLRSTLPEGYSKSLALVHGRPIIAWHMDYLLSRDVSKVILSLGYGEESVRNFIDYHYGHIFESRIVYCVENKPLGTGGALRYAMNYCDDDTVVVHNSDSFIDYSLADVLADHRERSAVITIVVSQQDNCLRYGKVTLGTDSKVTKFDEKDRKNVGPGCINAGVYFVERHALAEWQAGDHISFERQILPHWLGKGLYASESNGAFIDIGTPESIAGAEAVLVLGGLEL